MVGKFKRVQCQHAQVVSCCIHVLLHVGLTFVEEFDDLRFSIVFNRCGCLLRSLGGQLLCFFSSRSLNLAVLCRDFQSVFLLDLLVDAQLHVVSVTVHNC